VVSIPQDLLRHTYAIGDEINPIKNQGSDKKNLRVHSKEYARAHLSKYEINHHISYFPNQRNPYP
jgi:hypothetical protein